MEMKAWVPILLGMCTLHLGIAQEIYRVVPKSTFVIEGTSSFHDWSVEAKNFDGMLEFTQKDPSEDLTGKIVDIALDIKVDAIKSERGKTMDDKMYKALKKERHPRIHFKFEELTRSKQEGKEYVVTGILTIAGAARKVRITSGMAHTDDAIHMTGKKDLKLTDFKMEPPSAMFGQIVTGDDIEVAFDLVFSKKQK